MRILPSPIIDAANAAPHKGIAIAVFVLVFARDGNGDPVEFGFWRGHEPVSVTIVSPDTGGDVSKDYRGGGGLLHVSEIEQTTDMSVATVAVEFAAGDAAVRDMVFGHDLKKAAVWIHSVLLDTASRLPADKPQPFFAGTVQQPSEPRPAMRPGSAAQGSIRLDCSSAMAGLLRTNPARRDDASQSKRSGDKLLRYVNSVKKWVIERRWGAK
jgi:hypothetical protein